MFTAKKFHNLQFIIFQEKVNVSQQLACSLTTKYSKCREMGLRTNNSFSFENDIA